MNELEIKNKQKDQSRHLYRILCEGILVAVETAIFVYIWLTFYNPNFRAPYIMRGNYFVAVIYMVLSLLFSSSYGGLRIGYYKTFSIVFSQCVTAFITNVIIYIAVIIPAATWYLTPVPAVVFMTVLDIAAITVWGNIVNYIFHRLFPPQQLLLISELGTDEFMAKFALRTDRYNVVKSIIINRDRPGGNGRDKNGYRSRHRVESEDISRYFGECAKYDGVVIGDVPSGQRNDLLKYCYSKGIRTYTIPKITDVILKSSETLHVFDTPIFLSRNKGLSFEQEAVKRASDIVMSLTALILLSPVLLIVAVAIKLEDGGPVFYKQRRCTKNGVEFDILKFRSMIVDAEKSGISVPATEKDPRITKVGHIIRAARIDELPQLINILKGEMSVVGPRPERIEHVRQYTKKIPEFAYRLTVKGGLTGYAQVYGKYNTTAYDKLKLDLMYIENYSFVLDLEIILRTIQVLFSKESTEGFDQAASAEITKESEKK